MFRHLRLSRDRAFTLIELLVVILIIGILLAIALPAFLGQTAKAQDSVAQQNLYNVYLSAKSAAWAPDSHYPDPPGAINLGTPGDTSSDSGLNGTSLFSVLDGAEPEFVFATGVSATDPNQIEVDELNPQEVSFADQSASGRVFCLVDVEASNYNDNGVPAGLTWLKSSGTDSVDGEPPVCDTVITPVTPPAPVTPVTPTPPTPPSPCDPGTNPCSVIVTAHGGVPTGVPSPGPGCTGGTYWNAVWGMCLPYQSGTAEYAPTISDANLNEVNAGEAAVPSGDVRFTADIAANDVAGGTYKFQFVKGSQDFSSATSVPSPDGSLDTSSSDLDYHQDTAISGLGGDGTYYWRAQASTADGTATSCTASFVVSSGVVSSHSDCGDGSGPDNDTISSNGGIGPTGGGGGGGGGNTVDLVNYNLSSCVGPDYSACFAARTVTDITSPATIGADTPSQYAFDNQRSADDSATPADFYRITVPTDGEVDIPVSAGVTYSAWGDSGSYGYDEITEYGENSSTVDGIWAVSADGYTTLVIEVDNPANFSSSVTVTAYPPPDNTTAPSITDIDGAQVDQLSANNGSWNTATGDNPYPISGYTYTWETCDSSGNSCSPIENNSTAYATGSTFVPFFPEYDQTGTFRVFLDASSQSGMSQTFDVASTVYTIPAYTRSYYVSAFSIPNDYYGFSLVAAPIIYDTTLGGFVANGYNDFGEDGLEEADLPATVSGTQQQPGIGGTTNADYYYLIAPPGESLTLTSTFSGGVTGVKYHLYDFDGPYGSWNLISTLSSANGASVSTTVPSDDVDPIGNASMIIEVGDNSSSSNDPYTMTVTSP
jgi:prepilin-type N-terminal cleavage/methylation domain-containing protein